MRTSAAQGLGVFTQIGASRYAQTIDLLEGHVLCP
jgi:hypothetical protein